MSSVPGFPLLGVVADDLPGAVVCATQIRERGFRTVITTSRSTAPENQEAFVTWVETRLRWEEAATNPVETPAELVKNAVRTLMNKGCTQIDFRVDPGLRRSYVDEIAGAIEGARFAEYPHFVIAVPAYPWAGHITRVDTQLSFTPTEGDREVNAATQLFGGAPHTILTVETLRKGGAAIEEKLRACASAGGDPAADRTARVLAAAASEDDLRLLASAVHKLARDSKILTVSSGAWLRYYPPRYNEHDFVLVAIGAGTPTTATQLEALRDGRRALVLSPSAVTGLCVEKERLIDEIDGRSVIVISGSCSELAQESRLNVADAVAKAVDCVLFATRELGIRCRGLIATGDYTANAVVETLKVTAIMPRGEIDPLSVVGVLSGGPWAGLTMVMKPGRAGNANVLTTLVDYLHVGQANGPPPVEE